MESLSPARIATALLLALPLVACGPSDETDRAVSGPIKGPFVVSNYFTPSGLMGDGATPERVTVDINENCKQPRPPGAQGDCYRFTYIPNTVHWAGAYWVYPANNWGATRGRPVIGPVPKGMNPDKPGVPINGYNHARVTFAMGALPAANTLHFWVGRLDGRTANPSQPYYDEGCAVYPETTLCTDNTRPLPDGTPAPVPYLFQPGESSGDATTEWQTLTIDLTNWSVDRLIAAFGFSTNDEANRYPGTDQGLPQVIYLDDIVWE